MRKDEILLKTSTLDAQLQDVAKVFAHFVKASPDVEDKQTFGEMLAWADGSRELLQGITDTVSPTRMARSPPNMTKCSPYLPNR
jgi:hypothetical protein